MKVNYDFSNSKVYMNNIEAISSNSVVNTALEAFKTYRNAFSDLYSRFDDSYIGSKLIEKEEQELQKKLYEVISKAADAVLISDNTNDQALVKGLAEHLRQNYQKLILSKFE